MVSDRQRPDYTSVTEVPGNRVSHEALDMALTRYEFAARRCSGKRVLELACGSGVGLAHLSTRASLVVGGDCTWPLLSTARALCPSVPLIQFDVHALPFQPETFDVAVLFEALYFFADAERFVRVCARVLRPKGVLLIAAANPEVPAFNPALYSTKYWTAAALDTLLHDCGFSATLFGGFPVRGDPLRSRLFAGLKKTAVRLDLIPRTMKGKQLLKRVVFGPLKEFPRDLADAGGAYREPIRLDRPQQASGYRVIYAEGRKNART